MSKYMKLSEGIEWAVHCCTLLAALPTEKALPLARLAEFFELPPAYLAKQMQDLSRAGLVDAVKGPGGGYRLAKQAKEITLLSVVEALDGPGPAFRCSEIRQKGPSCVRDPNAYAKPCGIASAMHRAERAYRAELASVTIEELTLFGSENAPPRQVDKTLQWLESVLR